MNKKNLFLLAGAAVIGYSGVFMLKVLDIVKVVAESDLEDTKAKNHATVMNDIREIDALTAAREKENAEFWDKIKIEDPRT